MKVTITDREVLSSVGTSQIAAYLGSRNWKYISRYFDTGTVWQGPDDQSKLVLPHSSTLDDYAEGVADILAVLARVERRSQEQVLRDIDEATKDVIRIRLSGDDLEDGAIPLEEAAHLIGHARDMMMAAACSTVRRRTIHTGRKPTEAVEYIKRVRMGQTERGSFILTMQSEVAPQLDSGQQELFPDLSVEVADSADPFERRVTRTLARALMETHNALTETLTTRSVESFLRATEAGVSANLCDAVAGLTLDNYDRDISISLSWSPTRKVPTQTPSFIHFPSDHLPILREVARVLRERAVHESFELRGPVIKLHRPDATAVGQVTIDGVVEGYLRRVTVELWGQDYELAIEAHRQTAILSVEGELSRETAGFKLRNPRNLIIEKIE
ncbi:hypothetical protein [Armatimonas rosea]|uniref:Uncharacterized protein n=1 Tax=Armatimonas rosea TaxID=685828 RepID=A0A7W9WA33_ARMRO|nr:hypothetical protein [Armatimonas rosea]MBB6053926.1 hypothetical protein [Armatimonas rosea]